MTSVGCAAKGALAGVVLALALTGCGASGNAGAELTGAPPSVQSSTPQPSDSPTDPESIVPPETPKPSPSFPTDPDAAGTANLTISIRLSPESQPKEYVLECSRDGVGSSTTMPNAEAACEVVRRLGASFFNAKPDPNKMCTQQYGGPQTATITGTVDGQRVHAYFSATDGCEIARWNALQAVLGSAGAT
ncbi:serine protease inhibitor [Arthrobacter sp. JZ12]|uniref:SSI family serine proteinase inhibitor n=1 Tax=Arthrobacter sp. JZ12 TaxID=2654190 RepID=UPI002B4730FD|nr:SSI family serine proteinase inhibitor [Arthrobacter sp. JZ12]WRH23919.1 serine protease inhibitor [Arthrobacter sp. JZ12]